MINDKLKRFLSLFLALTMVFSVVPVSAYAEENEPAEETVVEEILDDNANEETAEYTAESSVAAEETEASSEPVEVTSEPTQAPSEEPTEESSEETQASKKENPYVAEFQQRIDELMELYVGEKEISAAVEAMDEDTLINVYWEIMLLDEDLYFAQEDGLLTQADMQKLAEDNPEMLIFAEEVCTLAEPLVPSIGFYKSVNVLNDSITVSDTANSISVSGNTVTATAKGGLLSKKTSTITITNGSGKTATLSFDYSLSKANSHTFPSGSGTISVLLNAGESVTYSITSNSGFSNLTVTLTMSNFSLVEAKAASNVTFSFDSNLGSVTADGVAVNDGDVLEKPVSGTALVATPKSGAKVLGWIDTSTNQVIAASASCTLEPSQDISVKAVFISSSSPAWFQAGKGTPYWFDNLNDASEAAKNNADKQVTLLNNATLPAGDYTIPSGVTLLIPFDDAYTVYTTEPGHAESYSNPSAYRTLTMATGANLIVNGKLCVSGKLWASGGGQQSGSPVGKYGHIKMESGSTITINSKAGLYAYGFVTGAGRVTAKNGSEVYECFQLCDYRGGDQSTSMKEPTFANSQYYIQNVEVPLTIEAGAVVKAWNKVTVTFVGVQGSAVSFIGPSGSMFNITRGSVTKWYDGTKDRMFIELDGDCTVANMKIKVSLLTIDSSKYILPIANHLTTTIRSGSNLQFDQRLCLLPGSEVIIEEGATVSINKDIYIYDEDVWGGYAGAADARIIPVRYSPTKTFTRDPENLGDATVLVNGTLNVASGNLYTTAGGAKIYSTNENGTAMIYNKAGTVTETKQYSQVTDTYVSIPVETALLQNADGTTVVSDGSFTYRSGKWTPTVCENHVPSNGPTCTEAQYCVNEGCGKELAPALGHSYGEVTYSTDEAAGTVTATTSCTRCGDEETETADIQEKEIPATCFEKAYVWKGAVFTQEWVTESEYIIEKIYDETSEMLPHTKPARADQIQVVDPTCETAGSITYECTICHQSQTETTDDALGHNWSAGTCTAPKTCSVCGATEGAALGHTEVVDAAKNPNCTETGLTEGKHCSVCNTVLTAQQTVPALGHTEVVDKAVAPTCTATGLTEGKHCSVCDAVLVAQETVDALGHTEVVDAAVDATCTTTGKTEGKHCSVCNTVLTAQQTVPATGHTNAEAVKENVVDSDYNNPGSYDLVIYCATCGAELSRQSHEISVKAGVASVNKQNYGTLADAVSHAKDGDTIVLLTDVTLETAVIAAGKTVDLNGKTLTGTLIGTMAMNGGTLITAENYKMIGPDGDYYTSTNAVWSLGADNSVTFHSGNVTLSQSWRTMEDQTLSIEKDATFTIPKDKNFQVYGNATLEGKLINNGTLEICAGGTVTGDVTGVIKLTGGDLITSTGHKMIGANADYYLSTDAVFTLDADMNTDILSGTVTLNQDWWTLANQSLKISKDATFIIPKDTKLNVRSTVVVEGKVAVYGDVVLYDPNATIETDVKDLIISTVVPDHVVWYNEADGMYVVHAHSYDSVVTDPDCVNGGYITYTCSNCGDSYKDSETAALGHTAGAAATCTTAQTCTVCGAELTAALGHAEVAHDAKAPTCTEIGWDAYVTCSRCDYTTYEKIDALSHEEVEHAGQAATCTEDGWKDYVTCTRCDYTTYEKIDALSHEEVEHAGQAATCTEDGWDAYVTCSRCDYTTYVEKAALKHDMQLTDEKQEATCAEPGKEAVYTCSRNCGHTTGGEEIPATGKHQYVDGMCECGAEEPAKVVFDFAAKSLILEGMVRVRVNVSFKDNKGNDLDKNYVLENGGVEITGLDGKTKINAKLSDGGIYAATNTQEYIIETDGIPAKNMDKNFVFRAFITLDGKTIYSEPTEYGVITYIDRMIKRSTTTEKLKATLAGLLNYGAAAQKYFDGKSGYIAPAVKMNECLKEYVDAGYLNAKYLNQNWDANYITALQKPAANMTVNFVKTELASISSNSLVLEGAISIFSYMSVGNDLTNFSNNDMVVYYWTQKDYEALAAKNTPLTKENASYFKVNNGFVDVGYGPEGYVISEQIPAKDLGNTLYFAMCVTDNNGVEHCSGVTTYNPEYYAQRQISKNQDVKLVELMKWMVEYGEYARRNFS